MRLCVTGAGPSLSDAEPPRLSASSGQVEDVRYQLGSDARIGLLLVKRIAAVLGVALLVERTEDGLRTRFSVPFPLLREH